MWPTQNTKAAYLPVQRTDWGFRQSSAFTNADLYHEEIVELDSPFAAQVRADTLSLHFLFLGDQNAGKSTFLHAWSFEADPGFRDITAELPILASQFVNSRFLDATASIDQARDEPPFLDTDVARATVLVTAEDLAFWLRERDLPLPPEIYQGGSSAIYCRLHFIEIGGDHLDRLMQRETARLAPEILEHSMSLLQFARRSVYMLNVQNLVTISDSAVALVPERWRQVEARLRFVLQCAPPDLQLLLCICRLPSSHNYDFFYRFFLEVLDAAGLLIRVANVVPLTLMAPQQQSVAWAPTDPSAILSLLSTLLGKKGTNMILCADTAPVSDCFNLLLKCHAELSTTSLGPRWISEAIFRGFLDGEHGLGFPPAQLLQTFVRNAEAMARQHFIILHHRGGFSDFRLEAHQAGVLHRVWIPPDEGIHEWSLAVRLPSFPAAFHCVSALREMNLFEFNADGNRLFPTRDLETACCLLEEEIFAMWARPIAFPGVMYLFEDWIYLQRLRGVTSSALRFPAELAAVEGLGSWHSPAVVAPNDKLTTVALRIVEAPGDLLFRSAERTEAPPSSVGKNGEAASKE